MYCINIFYNICISLLQSVFAVEVSARLSFLGVESTLILRVWYGGRIRWYGPWRYAPDTSGPVVHTFFASVLWRDTRPQVTHSHPSCWRSRCIILSPPCRPNISVPTSFTARSWGSLPGGRHLPPLPWYLEHRLKSWHRLLPRYYRIRLEMVLVFVGSYNQFDMHQGHQQKPLPVDTVVVSAPHFIIQHY